SCELIVQPFQIWKHALPTGIAVAVLSPLVCTYRLLTSKSWFEEEQSIGHYYPNTNADMHAVMTGFMVFLFLFLILTCAIDTISVIFVFKQERSHHSNKAERNMFILALLDFFIEAGYSTVVVSVLL
ncbi:hypothetical protein OESDEN_02295, partial [Oesophagostomum dentatum]